MIQNKEVLEQIREEAVKELNSYDCRILVCSGTGCVATGSQKIYEKFMEIAKDAPGVTIEFGPHDKDAHVGVKKTGCQGVCELGPLVRIQKGDDVIQYTKVQIEDCQEIFEKSVQGNETIERLLYQKGGKVSRGPEDIPFIAKQTRIVLKNCGKFDAESLNEYIASGGFQALEKAMFEMDPDLVIDQVDKSGIRGRGGGGFPAGKKWIQVARQADPGDFMKKSFDLVIGVELLKMFCRHDIDSIVEVLLFSVARQMVIDHLAIKEALIGCVAVAILFAVRRFLFVPILDNPDEQERKLEKDQYIKERIADAIAAYKKEIGATSLRERAESSINTAAADPLNEKEGSE